jgi:hypothetical protein
LSNNYDDQVSDKWLALEAEYGERLHRQLKNREWRSLVKRYGGRFGFDYEEFVAWGKWVKSRAAKPSPQEEAPQDTPQEVGPESTGDDAGGQFISDDRYWYDKDGDVYVTFINDVGPLTVPGPTHRAMLDMYSNTIGEGTINQVCREFGMPRQWFTKYKQIHGWTKDHEPFTAEEMMERDPDELVAEALQKRRAVFYRKFEQQRWKEIQKEATKWRQFDDFVLRRLEDAIGGRKSPPVKKLNLKVAKHPYAAVVGLSDFHWGKYSDEENGENFDREIARKRLFTCTEDVLGRMAHFGAPDKLIVPVGSDFLHIDNDSGTTTRGTPQDTDGNFYSILETGCILMEEWVESLRQVGPVHLILMNGNHDRAMGFAILLYLKAYFRNAPDVTVSEEKTPRQYIAYGKNLIGFVHGDGVSKTKDLAGHMAREAAPDWAGCPYRTVYTGHLHYEKTETDSAYGVTRRQLPSLSGPDRWHARSGYVGSPKSLPVYLHDKERGLVAVIHSPPDDEK